MLDILKRRLQSAIGQYEWSGERVYFKRLSAAAWIKIQALATPDADSDASKSLAFFVELLALTLCTESGGCECDSDEGRETLRQLGLNELQTLGELSLKHSGLGDKAKN